MSEDRRRLEIVVVTYNSAPVLAGLIESLRDGLHGLDWHLTIVDNASTDGSEAAARALAPEAVVVQTGRNLGYAGGINAGVHAAEPFDALLVLNPDVRLEPGCVRALLDCLDRPGTGIAVPLLIDGDGVRIDSLRREPTIPRALGDSLLGARRSGRRLHLSQTVSADEDYRAEKTVDWAEGSTLLISAACWDAVGPWDESFFLYCEETDFALRARDAGFATRFTPQARATHLEGGSATSATLWPLVTVNWVRLYRRRHGVFPTIVFWVAVVLRELTRAALGRHTSRHALRALLSPRRLTAAPGPDWLRA